MTVSLICAAFGLVATLGVAFWLLHRKFDRPAFAAMLAAPLVAGLVFVAAGTVLKGRTPAPAAGQDPTPTTAQTHAEPAQAAAGESTATPAPGGAGAVGTLRQEAEDLRRSKHFAEAKEIYAKITRLAPFDADAWADLGDASAAAAGGDLKAGVQAIDRALEIDSKHPKALWLKASLELQEKHYSGAADLWQRLLDQLDPTSNDAQIVRANLDETRTLATRQGAGR